jgi:hypothetical protein
MVQVLGEARAHTKTMYGSGSLNHANVSSQGHEVWAKQHHGTLSSLQLGVAQLDKGGEGCACCERPELYCGDRFLIAPGVKELLGFRLRLASHSEAAFFCAHLVIRYVRHDHP